MGVFSLWDLLLTTAQKISIQQISGKILAIDASIWLVKADSIFSEDIQKIKCVLQKIIYLRKNNILPVFVFDGIPPAIKRKTLQKRRTKARQGSQTDVRKRTEIQVMRLLQNEGKQSIDKNNQKHKKIAEKQLQISQINQILANLNEAEEKISQIISDQDIMKIRLQSQVLTYKYQLLLEDPRLQGLQRMDINDFQLLQNDQKLEYLHLIQSQFHSKNFRKNNKEALKELSKLTPQQQIFYEMQKIQKKSKLRKLQDDLYRKTFQQNIKIENGYEIIQQVRNGQKRIMKRKIPQNKQKGGWGGKATKKEKNDFSAIFNYKTNNQEGQKEQEDVFDMYDDTGPDLFLADLIGKDLKKTKQQSNSTSKNSLLLPNLHTKDWKLEKEKEMKEKPLEEKEPKANERKVSDNKDKKSKQTKKEKICKVNKKQNHQSDKEQSQLDQFLGNSLIGIQLRKKQPNKIIQNHNQDIKGQSEAEDTQFGHNPDNLPNFINYQHLLIRHLDSQDHKNIEFQKLLQMIGIPYVKAVSEAEAQCAYLQKDQLVDGIVTEDSDIFLFGARNVFRGVFNDNIKYFSSHKILQKIKMNRQKLIIFALLLGSDYTDGIKGIGIVNAMEILKIFDNFEKLEQFKKWARYADILHSDEKNTTQHILKDLSNDEQKQFYQFHKRFKNYWHIDDDFPKNSVIRAYLNPQVIDQTRIKEMKQTKFFELKQFNQEPVRVFMKERLLLTNSETTNYCNILKKPFTRQKQKKLTDFFVGQDHEFAKIRSKRLMKAIGQQQQAKKHQQPKSQSN